VALVSDPREAIPSLETRPKDDLESSDPSYPCTRDLFCFHLNSRFFIR